MNKFTKALLASVASVGILAGCSSGETGGGAGQKRSCVFQLPVQQGRFIL